MNNKKENSKRRKIYKMELIKNIFAVINQKNQN